MSFPFPFFGAGDAAYFEWAEVHVLFGRTPSDKERAAIEARVPPPLDCSWEGPELMVSSDQFVHLAIAEHYPADAKDEDEGMEWDRWFFAAPSRVRRFNEDIEAWLTYAHDRTPILAAFRREDGEAGGTQLSDWHTWSLDRLPEVFPALEPIIASFVASAEEDDSQVSYLVSGVLQMAVASDRPLPDHLDRWARPGLHEWEALQAGDGAAVQESLRTLLGEQTPGLVAAVLKTLARRISLDRAALLDTLRAAAEPLLAHPGTPGELLQALALAAARAGDTQVLDSLRDRASVTPKELRRLNAAGYQLVQESDFPAALALYDAIVDLPGKDLSLYCNALWIVQHDNTGLPIDPEQCRRFLAVCLPYGPDNPAIFFNAAAVWMELGETDRVLDCLKLARRNGYDRPRVMRDEALFAPLSTNPRFQEIFADLK